MLGFLLASCTIVLSAQGTLDAGEPTVIAAPANPQASADARRVLEYLYSLPGREGNRVLSGQNVSSANAELSERYVKFYQRLEEATGKAPAVMSMDYAWEAAEPDAIAEANRLLIAHWQRGGLVSVSIHPANPWTGRGIKRRNTGGAAYLDAIKPGTEANERWMEFLRVTADGLVELRDAGIVVLWRPLHEMNGNWFWWSAGDDDGWARPEEFRALWVHMFDYLSKERGLNNLLWLYGPNAQTNDLVKPTTYYYPGDEYVDVIGIDHYDNTLATVNGGGGYDDLLALGKPIGLAEVGPAFWRGAHPKGEWDNTVVVRSIREQYPAMCYFTYWHGWGRTRMGIVENANAAELLADPWVITLDEVAWREAWAEQ